MQSPRPATGCHDEGGVLGGVGLTGRSLSQIRRFLANKRIGGPVNARGVVLLLIACAMAALVSLTLCGSPRAAFLARGESHRQDAVPSRLWRGQDAAGRPDPTSLQYTHNSSFASRPAGSGPMLRPRHVFINVGGNVGDSVAAFLTKGAPGIDTPPAQFDAIYEFKPNPAFAERYARYRGKSFHFEFIPAAAGAEDGTMSFSGGGLGGALIPASDNDAIAVRVYDFSKWLAATVAFDDVVVCKIDAEGAEFDIVRRMMTDGTLCLCNRLSIEWHGWIGNSNTAEAKSVMHPSTTHDQPDAPECLGRSDCFCHIPHLARRLPYFYCSLPRVTLWARSSCVGVGGIDESTPLLEHHEQWWPAVGSANAFIVYPETG